MDMYYQNDYKGMLSFYCEGDSNPLSIELCHGKKDAKSHAAFLATQYGTIEIRRGDKFLCEVDESYLDNQFG